MTKLLYPGHGSLRLDTKAPNALLIVSGVPTEL